MKCQVRCRSVKGYPNNFAKQTSFSMTSTIATYVLFGGYTKNALLKNRLLRWM